jgi:hypothetical protein
MTDAMDTMEMEKKEGAIVTVVEAVTRSPRTHVDSAPLPTDSMVTVPLSEAGTTPDDESIRGSILQPQIIVDERRDSSRPSSTEILKAFGRRSSQGSIDAPSVDSPTVSVHDADSPDARKSRARSRRHSDGSGKSEPVDWAELEKKEEQEPEGEGQDKVGLFIALDSDKLLTYAGYGTITRTLGAGEQCPHVRLQGQHQGRPRSQPVPTALVWPAQAPRAGGP